MLDELTAGCWVKFCKRPTYDFKLFFYMPRLWPGFLTDIYIFFQDFARGQILSFLYRIVGIAFLVTLIFGKSYKIASHPPFFKKKSIMFLRGVFLNPFNKSNLKKLKKLSRERNSLTGSYPWFNELQLKD